MIFKIGESTNNLWPTLKPSFRHDSHIIMITTSNNKNPDIFISDLFIYYVQVYQGWVALLYLPLNCTSCMWQIFYKRGLRKVHITPSETAMSNVLREVGSLLPLSLSFSLSLSLSLSLSIYLSISLSLILILCDLSTYWNPVSWMFPSQKLTIALLNLRFYDDCPI